MAILILEITAIFSLVVGLTGMFVIFFRKAPVLKTLPETGIGLKLNKAAFLDYWTKTKERAKTLPFLKDFSAEVLLQKMLSKFRVLALKLESRIAGWLESLRQRSKNKDNPQT